MNLHSEKIRLIKWLADINDFAILQKVEKIRKATITKSSTKGMNIEELEARAIASEKAIKERDVTSFEALSEEMKSW